VDSIELKRISKNYGGHEVLSRMDLAVTEGEFLVILGASGGGKTTLLNLIAGLLAPGSGQILFAGKDVTDAGVAERNVAYVFQDYALYPHMTVAGNLRFPLENFRLPRAEIETRVQDTLDMLKLMPVKDHYPAQLSGGQKQRVAIGRALVRDPFVFLFDEPLSSLDQQLREHLRIELKQLHRQIGKTFIYVTHDQTSAMILGDRIAFLDDKKIRQIAAPEELYQKPGNVAVAKFLGFPSINLLSREDFRSLTQSEAPQAAAQIGVRPEHLRIVENAGGRFAIEWLQEVGYARYANFKVGGKSFCGKCDNRNVEAGRKIRIDVDERGLLFFDAGGSRIPFNET